MARVAPEPGPARAPPAPGIRLERRELPVGDGLADEGDDEERGAGDLEGAEGRAAVDAGQQERDGKKRREQALDLEEDEEAGAEAAPPIRWRSCT